jgi:hypothetical protein
MWPEAGTATLRKALAALELAAGYTAAEHQPLPWGPRLVDGPGPGAGSARPGGAVLDANSYTAGRASDSKRRESTLSMRPYSIASAAVMK